jgi:hypothetical protein
MQLMQMTIIDDTSFALDCYPEVGERVLSPDGKLHLLPCQTCLSPFWVELDVVYMICDQCEPDHDVRHTATDMHEIKKAAVRDFQEIEKGNRPDLEKRDNQPDDWRPDPETQANNYLIEDAWKRFRKVLTQDDQWSERKMLRDRAIFFSGACAALQAISDLAENGKGIRAPVLAQLQASLKEIDAAYP